MSPRRDVSVERKSQIIDTAMSVFARLGVHDARMDDIVAESGLSKGALYWYFKSKDEIIIAIIDRLFQREFDEMEKAITPDITAYQNLQQFVDLACQEAKSMLRLMPVAYEFIALAFRNKYAQHALHVYFNRYMDILTPIIQTGIDTGEFRPVDATEVALAAGAIFEGTILLWVYDRTRVDPVRHIGASMKLLFEGVLSKPVSPS